MAFIPFVASVLSGWLLVHLVGPVRGMRPRWAAALVEVALGAGAGAGLASFLYFFLLLAGAASSGTILMLDAVILASLGALAWRARARISRTTTPLSQNRPSFRWNWVILLLLGACLLPILMTEIEINLDNPHGGWDAWAIWNLRARYLAGPAETWRNAVSPLLTGTHPDYPLLLSGFIAETWKAAGGEPTTAIPIATTFLFGGLVVALAIASLALLRGTSLALLAGIVLLANRPFLDQFASQYSDIPLALYYLGTLLAVFLSEAPAGFRGPVLALAGLFASLAAWTKDEGVVFAAVFLISFTAFEWWTGRWRRLLQRLPWLLGGALPGLLVVVGFKLFLVPRVNPMVAQSPAHATARMLMGGRWWNLIRGLIDTTYDMGAGMSHPLLILAVLALALGVSLPVRLRGSLTFGAVILAAVLAGYCAALIVNPTLLQTPYATPLPRMYSQLWPSFVLLAFLPLRALEEMAPAPPEAGGKSKAKSRKRAR